NQLVSFTMFKAKDPFVPKVNEQQTPANPAADAYYNEHGTAPPPGFGTSGTDSGAGGSGAGSGAAGNSATGGPAPPAPIAYATINLNGSPEQVQVKASFPSKSPLFVLRALEKKQAKIGVAGGSFDDGQAVILKFGKKVTLVNTATGVRYELKLVYTGA